MSQTRIPRHRHVGCAEGRHGTSADVIRRRSPGTLSRAVAVMAVLVATAGCGSTAGAPAEPGPDTGSSPTADDVATVLDGYPDRTENFDRDYGIVFHYCTFWRGEDFVDVGVDRSPYETRERFVANLAYAPFQVEWPGPPTGVNLEGAPFLNLEVNLYTENGWILYVHLVRHDQPSDYTQVPALRDLLGVVLNRYAS